MLSVFLLAILVMAVLYIHKSYQSGAPIVQKINNIVMDGEKNKNGNKNDSKILIILLISIFVFLTTSYLTTIDNKLDHILDILKTFGG